jgi:hypothetical protein
LKPLILRLLNFRVNKLSIFHSLKKQKSQNYSRIKDTVYSKSNPIQCKFQNFVIPVRREEFLKLRRKIQWIEGFVTGNSKKRPH